MKNIKPILFALCFISTVPAYYAYAEIAVVVSKSSSISSTDASELSRVYLGKSKSLGGANVEPINQLQNSVSDEFNKNALKKSSSQVKAYWSKLIFTGKGTPPKEVKSDADVISKVAADPNAVGYINANSITDDVKVILKL